MKTAIATLLALFASPAFADDLQPLTDDQVAILRAPGNEPLEVVIEQSYPRTNEWRLDVLFPELAGLGGGYVGVGADQNYTLAGAAKSELVWLIDHDPLVRDLHILYGALIRSAATAEAFIAFFDKANLVGAREVITAGIADDKQRKTALRRFDELARSPRHMKYFKLQRGRKSPDGKPVTWLGDPAIYAHVKKLFETRRVHTVAADLGGPRSMTAIADAAKKLDTTIRVVYVSNAEAFFDMTDRVRANYTGLPHDDKSVLVRTVYMGLPKAKGSVWHYQTHVYQDFVAKLARKREYPSFRVMVDDLRGPDGAKFIDPIGRSRITPELPRRKRAPAPKKQTPVPASGASIE
jgi:hypothetical protein